MTTSPITVPEFSDSESLQEFVDALADHATRVEQNIARLKEEGPEREIVADLFRAVHNIKGDAALCKVAMAVTIAHPIETVLSRLREGEIGFSDILAEALLLAIDRLELAADALVSGKSLESLHLPALVSGLEKLAVAPPGDIDRRSGELIEAVSGFRAASAAAFPAREKLVPPPPVEHSKTAEDLRFFRGLANQFESRSPLFKGRTTRVLRLALETNNAAGLKIDPLQLEAAVYMHDVGMMFLPEDAWLKLERMTPEGKQALRSHPEIAAGLLSRIPGWEMAAEMVAQHHEMPDGAGYPYALGTASICDGAKVLAIVDAFEAVMLKHIHRGRNRSVLRAIAEINACDNQFSPEWIEPFNQVIRRTLDAR